MANSDKQTILHIDDSVDSLNLTRRWLESAGYNVISYNDAKIALAAIDTVAPDLVLLDALMPEMDGYEFCSQLQPRKKLSRVPVVFMTALFSRQDKARAFAAGAVDFLVKPVRQERLLETVKKYLYASGQWNNLQTKKVSPLTDVRSFLVYLFIELKLPAEQAERHMNVTAENLYSLASELNITEEIIAQQLAKFCDLKYIAEIDAKEVNLGALPTSFCRARQVIPINEDGDRVFVVANPLAWKLLDDITSLFGTLQKPKILVTNPKNITTFFGAAAMPPPSASISIRTTGVVPPTRKRFEAATMQEIEAQLSGIYQIEEETVEVSDDSEESAPVILMVNKIVDDAIRLGASDIHLEPWEKEVAVRYRVDGDMRLVRKLHPQKLILPLVARIKIMSHLSITERRLPQDGRIVYKDGIDLRVSVVPSNYGEKVVMRLLDKKKSAQPLDSLGFSTRNLELYREKIQTPYGMILHVGPTGSGKSMTLFAALKEVQSPEINIQTIEDPIEYTLPGVTQVQTNQLVGLTFAKGLRSFLRQDPDVILVGEIRDRETADTAVEASLTGHLMLSTLHTNDSAATITRLIEMGIEPYLITSSLIMICAQRLLRRLCLKCRRATAAKPDEKRLCGWPENVPLDLYSAGSCPECGGTGYKGRIGVHEILVMDDALRLVLAKHGVSSEELKRIAVEKGGMTTLYWDSIEKVLNGVTSIKEAVAQVRQDDFDSRPAWLKKRFEAAAATAIPAQ